MPCSRHGCGEPLRSGGNRQAGEWLATVVARICLDMLHSRATRREDPFEDVTPAVPAHCATSADPEQEAVLAGSVSLVLLVVLDWLDPAEWFAFVLQDLFDLFFNEIATILSCSHDATRQLASRAHRCVRGAKAP